MPLFKQDILGNSLLLKKLNQTKVGQYLKPSGTQPSNTKSNGSNSNNSNSNNSNDTQTSNSNNKYLGTNPNDFESTAPENIEQLMTSNDISSNANPYSEHVLYMKDPGGFATSMNKNPQYATPLKRDSIGQNLDLFKSLVSNPSTSGGIIFSDNNMKIECKIKFFETKKSDQRGILGVMFNFIALSDTKLEDIEFQLTNYLTGELLNMQVSKVKYPDGVNTQYPQVLLKVELNDSFSAPPMCYLNGKIGMMNINNQFTLPLVITKFLEPLDVTVESYTAMWYEYTNSPDDVFQKMDAIMTNPMSGNGSIVDFLKKFGGLMNNLQFKVYPPMNKESFHDLEGCAVLNYKDTSHSIPVLFQVSFVPSMAEEFRFSLRAKSYETAIFSTLLLDIYSVVKFYINPVQN